MGLACAQRLAKDGFTLVLTGRQQDNIDAACATLDGQGHISVAAVVGVEADVDALFERVETTFGRLDLLFNNAGRNGSAVEVDALSVAEWNDIVATNLTGSFLCARAAFALMKRQSPKGGRIINNGSISAHAAPSVGALYGDETRDHRVDPRAVARRAGA